MKYEVVCKFTEPLTGKDHAIVVCTPNLIERVFYRKWTRVRCIEGPTVATDQPGVPATTGPRKWSWYEYQQGKRVDKGATTLKERQALTTAYAKSVPTCETMFDFQRQHMFHAIVDTER